MHYGKDVGKLDDSKIRYVVRAREKGLTEFELFLMSNHIRHVLGRISHPQTKREGEERQIQREGTQS